MPKIILTDAAGVMPVRSEAQKKRTNRYHFYKNLLTKTGISKVFPGTLDRLQKKFPAAWIVISIAILILSTAYLLYSSYNPFLYFRF